MLDLGAPFMFIHQFNFNDFILSRSQMKSPLIVVVVPIIPQKSACPESIFLLIFVNKNTELLVAVFLKALTSSISHTVHKTAFAHYNTIHQS
ncbi:15845_t:CDS:2 [Rhizophagus irregularis]|nr:15845_t:CDS:2 [Rhizophagus irregularis]